MRAGRCALCGRSLGDLPPVAGVEYVVDVDAGGDVVASTHVAVGEASSLLARQPLESLDAPRFTLSRTIL